MDTSTGKKESGTGVLIISGLHLKAPEVNSIKIFSAFFQNIKPKSFFVMSRIHTLTQPYRNVKRPSEISPTVS